MTVRISAATLLVAVAALGCGEEDLGGLTGGVNGQICNPVTNRPAPGAAVVATYTREGSAKTYSKKTTAGANGFFNLAGLPAGDVTIVGTAEDFVTSKLSVSVVGRENTELSNPACFDQPPEPGFGRIVGQVCNRHVGDFVTNGTVSVQLPDATIIETTTDAETGIFSLDGVPTGVQTVYVVAQGYQKTFTVEVVEGQQTLLEEQVADCTPPDPLTTGMIVGTICAAEVDGVVGSPLQGARVEIVTLIPGAEGEVFSDETIADGSFIIAGIPAPQSGLQVRATKGGFAYQWDDVNVFTIGSAPDGTNLTLDFGCQPLVPDDDRKYLVVNGTFDKIGNVLERMGLGQSITYAEGVPAIGQRWTDEVFSNYDELQTYDAVFINCGVEEGDFISGLPSTIAVNIHRYVQEGGSLYVSDWAYDLVERLYPDKINFLGDDTQNSRAEYGVSGAYTADVLEPGLAAYLGADTINIDFSSSNFALISDIGAGVTTYLRADMDYHVNNSVSTLIDTPITVGFNDGTGRVIFTTFHQESNGQGQDETLDGPEDLAMRYIVFSL